MKSEIEWWQSVLCMIYNIIFLPIFVNTLWELNSTNLPMTSLWTQGVTKSSLLSTKFSMKNGLQILITYVTGIWFRKNNEWEPSTNSKHFSILPKCKVIVLIIPRNGFLFEEVWLEHRKKRVCKIQCASNNFIGSLLYAYSKIKSLWTTRIDNN